MRDLMSQNNNGGNMVEIGNDIAPTIVKKFIEATKWIECDWITIRMSLNSVDMIRIHAVRIDGTDENLIFTKGQFEEMTIYRVLNMLRQIVHNRVGYA